MSRSFFCLWKFCRFSLTTTEGRRMRSAGETRLALMRAAADLTTADSAPTMRELAEKACVGYAAARRYVDNLKRAGLLVTPRTRRVDYRNRPVAEYSPPPPPSEAAADLGHVFRTWMR